MTHYATECLKLAFIIVNKQNLTVRLPVLTSDVIPIIQEVIKFAPPDKQGKMGDLLGKLQTQRARLKREVETFKPRSRAERLYPAHSPAFGDQNLHDHYLIYDAAEIIFRTSDLFDFARNEHEVDQQDLPYSEKFYALFIRVNQNPSD